MNNMRKVLGALALLSAGMLAAMQPALAQTTQADIPANPTLPIPSGTTDSDAGLVLSVWSPSLPLSLTYYTGLTYSDVQQNDIASDAGLVLDFGLVPQWNEISSATDLVYHLIAVDATGTNAARGLVTTAAFGSDPFTGNNADVASITGTNGYTGFVTAVNQFCASNPCVNTVDAGQDSWGASYNGALNVSAAGSVGTALGFYQMLGVTGGTTATATVTRFQNSLGNLGTWLLTQEGRLTYSIAGGPVVPLPAAVWLLISGLAGLGVVSRRRVAA
jgi:hypothetical protein